MQVTVQAYLQQGRTYLIVHAFHTLFYDWVRVIFCNLFFSLCVDKDTVHLSNSTLLTCQFSLTPPAPLKGPIVNVTATGKTRAKLNWNEVPVDDQQGFLINYTITYRTGNTEKCELNQFRLLMHVSLLYFSSWCSV